MLFLIYIKLIILIERHILKSTIDFPHQMMYNKKEHYEVR